MTPRVPAIKVADDGDGTGIRRPDSEACAAHAIHGHRVGAQRESQLEQAAFVEQVKIGLA